VIRWTFFALVAAGLTAYSFWIYLRVDLAVPAARRLALVRCAALLTVLVLLFDVRLPAMGFGAPETEWALLDASLSMSAMATAGSSPWASASARARELESDGWRVMTFGGERGATARLGDVEPSERGSLLAPALARAAESGARRVVVLSDLRFEDAVATRSALTTLQLDVTFEAFGAAVVNAGVARLDVPDFSRPDEAVLAEVEVFGGEAGDSLTVELFAEAERVASVRVPAPMPGLRSRATVELPAPGSTGRVRYTARVALEDDAFPEDDDAVHYAAVGHEEGALVLVTCPPDWEPR
jgi:hypothetical protein